MKKKIFLTVILILTLMLSLVACRGQKKVTNLQVVGGIKTEYELDEVPDFSNIKVLAVYNDESTMELGYSDLHISPLDTSLVGEKKITITYEGISVDFNVTVKGKSIDTAVLTGIKYQSGLPTQIFETEDTFDTIMLKVIATYSDGTTAIIEGSALSTNLGELDFKTAGKKTVVIKYSNMICEHVIEVVKPEITRIEVDAESINTVVEAGGTLNTSNIKVYAIYNNGDRTLIGINDPELDLTSGMPDLNIEGDKDYVIYYKDTFSCTIVISTTSPVLERIEINTDNATKSILHGDSLNTSTVTGTAFLSNNTSKTIANNALTFSYDISQKGSVTVTVSYTLDDITKSATYTVTVLGIKSVTINTNSISTSLNVDATFDYSGLSILVEDENGEVHVRNYREDTMTVNTDNLDTSIVGRNGYITVTYRGITSAQVIIAVVDQDTNYYITAVSYPDSLTKWLSSDSKNMKSFFKDSDNAYVVGDDNNFYFTLVISAYTPEGEKISGITSYTSVSEVYLENTKLSGDDLTKYVTIDESKNAFDFTEEAVGKTFTIHTRPRDGIDGYETDFTKKLTVTIVDGYNIYKAYELNYMTNWDDFNFNAENVYNGEEPRTQTKIVDDFLLGEWGVTRPAAMNGIVIHDNIDIKPSDIPKEYFLGADRTAELYDTICVFAHKNTVDNPHFTLYGNYFTISSNALPPVVKERTGNQTDIVSNAQLFGFTGDRSVKDAQWYGFDHNQFSTTVKDLYLRDDNPTSNTPADSPRRMRGLIGFKTWYQVVNIDNSIVQAFYISYIPDSDYQTVNITDSIFYNSWQNHLFVWSDNPFTGENNNENVAVDLNNCPNGVYPVLTLNAKNSSFTKSGGPIIISQTNMPDITSSAYCGPVINIDLTNDTDMWTYVTGTEAWFNSMGADENGVSILQSVALGITTMNAPLKNACGGSFLTNNPPVEDLTGGTFMNIVMVNLAAGMDLNETLKGTTDLDGKLVVDEEEILNMNDANGMGYANFVVALIKENLPEAPIFLSDAGGIGIYNGQTIISNIYSTFVGLNLIDANTVLGMAGITDLTPFGGSVDAAIAYLDSINTAALGQGEFITLYYNNMGIVLGYNIDKQTAE